MQGIPLTEDNKRQHFIISKCSFLFYLLNVICVVLCIPFHFLILYIVIVIYVHKMSVRGFQQNKNFRFLDLQNNILINCFHVSCIFRSISVIGEGVRGSVFGHFLAVPEV